MQFSKKIGQIIGWRPPFGVGAPPSGKSWIRHCLCHAYITDRVRSTMVRYCFHRCLSVHTWGGYPGQVQMVGGVPWVSPGQGSGPPHPRLDGVPPGRGYPRPPGTGQQMQYLTRRGRYASCVHAGGLSRCWLLFGIALTMNREYPN